MKQAARHYLQPLLEQKIDTLVYGCTHYPLLEPILRPLLPRSVRVVDPAVALVGSIARELDLWGLRRSAEMGTGANQFFVSGDAAAFADLAVPWLECQPQVSQIELQPVFFR
jgi:glutamate racemase